MKRLIIIYDNWCSNCSRFIDVIEKLDWFKLLKIEQLRDENITEKYACIDISLAEKQMASYINKWQYGYTSLFSIFLRIPAMWIFLPLFFILKITFLGQLLYVQLAIKRNIIPLHCTIDSCKR